MIGFTIGLQVIMLAVACVSLYVTGRLSEKSMGEDTGAGREMQQERSRSVLGVPVVSFRLLRGPDPRREGTRRLDGQSGERIIQSCRLCSDTKGIVLLLLE